MTSPLFIIAPTLESAAPNPVPTHEAASLCELDTRCRRRRRRFRHSFLNIRSSENRPLTKHGVRFGFVERREENGGGGGGKLFAYPPKEGRREGPGGRAEGNFLKAKAATFFGSCSIFFETADFLVLYKMGGRSYFKPF